MSETHTRRRIRAQASAGDAQVMGFVLDDDVQAGASARFDEPGDAPLGRRLFTIPGVVRVEASGATIWVKKDPQTDWATLKPAIAAAIRDVLDETDTPLGAGADTGDANPDAALLAEVEALLESQVNPAIASHGGRITADRVEDSTVYLRMSGGCQGCAASAATLRQGVERMLRAALPEIGEIVDVTDHAAGSAPFYERKNGPSPMLNRPVPEDMIGWEDGQIVVDPDYLAPRLGLTPEALRQRLRSGEIVGVTETGQGADAGRTRVVVRSPQRAWAAEIDTSGAAREIPPPRRIETAAGREQALAGRVRAYLAALSADKAPVTYGAIARALGLWMPGSVRQVTRALEVTMREDAAAGRPFIAARAASRGRDRLPGAGFFDLARALSRGPQDGESDAQFHARELQRVAEALTAAAE